MILMWVSSTFLLIHTAIASIAIPPPPLSYELPHAYFITFKDNTTADVRDNHLAYIRQLSKKNAKVQLRHVFSLGFDGYSASLTRYALDHVRHCDEILSIDRVGTAPRQQDGVIEGIIHEDTQRVVVDNVDIAEANIALDPVGGDKVMIVQDRGWNANRISHRNFTMGYTPGPWVRDQYLGKGVNMYVLDTGINLKQPGFKGSQVSLGKNLVHWRNGPKASDNDVHGHGTMCAAVIAGSKHGLSPEARTYGVKIADDQNRSACDDVVAGIEWVYNQPGNNNMKVISMSHYGFTGKPDVTTTVSAAIAKGMHFVVCAGNNGRDSCRVQPSNAKGVISVGSVNGYNKLPVKGTVDSGGREMEDTNIGKCVTIFAPGTKVPSLSTKNLDPNYRFFSWGTSIAAPQVAAIIANRLSAVGPQTPAEMKQWLQDTATKDQIEGDLKGAPNLILYTGPGQEIKQKTLSSKKMTQQ